MDIAVRAVVIAVACSLCACSAAGQAPPPGGAPEAIASTADPTTGDTPLYLNRAMIPPTPEMLKAALSNDPDAMRDAISVTASSCQASSTCPAQFASCTSWSTPSLCSATCGVSFCLCRPLPDCEGEPRTPREVDNYNSFRICFDPDLNGCTEWSKTTSQFCGC